MVIEEPLQLRISFSLSLSMYINMQQLRNLPRRPRKLAAHVFDPATTNITHRSTFLLNIDETLKYWRVKYKTCELSSQSQSGNSESQLRVQNNLVWPIHTLLDLLFNKQQARHI